MTWLQSSEFCKAMENRNLIAILPSAGNSDYGNWPDYGRGYDFPRFFFDELMPFIYNSFPVSSKRVDNYIAGQSMGGYGATYLGFLHPEKFAGIAAYGSSLRESTFLKSYIGKSTTVFRNDALAHPTSFPTEYGPIEYGIKRKEVNVICKYNTVNDFLDSGECMWNRLPDVIASGLLPSIYIACGTNDQFYETTVHFNNVLTDSGITDCKFVYGEGIGHDEVFMNEQFSESLVWFGL